MNFIKFIGQIDVVSFLHKDFFKKNPPVYRITVTDHRKIQPIAGHSFGSYRSLKIHYLESRKLSHLVNGKTKLSHVYFSSQFLGQKVDHFFVLSHVLEDYAV